MNEALFIALIAAGGALVNTVFIHVFNAWIGRHTNWREEARDIQARLDECKENNMLLERRLTQVFTQLSHLELELTIANRQLGQLKSRLPQEQH